MFRSKQISERVIRIIDPMNVGIYLIIGDKKACLLDTGCGLGNLREYVKTLTNKPVFVILTHGHFDHVGGASLFDEVYLNEKDLDVYKEHTSDKYRNLMIQSIPKEMKITLDDISPVVGKPFLSLTDKQRFDLGGITIEMVSVPGHTKGTMMALIVEEKMMLYGDACGVGVLLYEDYATTVSEYLASLKRLKTNYTGAYSKIIRNHGTFESELSLLDNVIECCNEIIEKRDAHIPTQVFGQDGFFYAKEIDENNNRIDGLFGNICYRFDKAK